MLMTELALFGGGRELKIKTTLRQDTLRSMSNEPRVHPFSYSIHLWTGILRHSAKEQGQS